MKEQVEKFLVMQGPALLSLPLQVLPREQVTALIIRALNHSLHQPLAAGQLQFMDQRSVLIEVSDLRLSLPLTLNDQQLAAARQPAEVRLRGECNDLLRLMSEDVDPDTLFFHRRLVIEGDTALGLALKNCLDSLEFSGLAARVRQLAGWPGSLVEKYQPLL